MINMLRDIAGGNLTSLFAKVRMGQVPGAEIAYIHGYSDVIGADSSDPTVCWPLGGGIADTNLFPNAAVPTVYVKSDTLLGGVNPEEIEVKVTYVGADHAYHTIVETTPFTMTDVFHIIYAEVTTENSVGDIYFSSADFVPPITPALETTMGYISANAGVSQTPIYAVPQGKTLLICEFTGGTSKGELVRVLGKYRKNVDGAHGAWLTSPSLMTFESTSILNIPGFLMKEGSDFIITAYGTSGTAPQDTTVTGILFDNSFFSPEALENA
jgi:hypothetical protein